MRPTMISLGATLASASSLAVAAASQSPASSSAPHWVTYWDAWTSGETGPPDASAISGYNTFILAFLLSSGPADQAVEWASLDETTRSTAKSQYSAAGINLMVSAFGSSETPSSSGLDAVTVANTMSAWVKTNGLDGIDVDYEDFDAINKADGAAETWLITFTQTLRSALPSGQYILTHAPVAPWFSPIYTAGAYAKVDKEAGSLIDWYNVQFYNQGASEYTTCTGLLTTSSSTFPSSAVFEINSVAGVPLEKIVIGRLGTTADGNNGFQDSSDIASCLVTAKKQGWTAGVMSWQWPHADSAWIATVRSLTWPVDSSSAPTTSSQTSKMVTVTTSRTLSTSTPTTSIETASTTTQALTTPPPTSGFVTVTTSSATTTTASSSDGCSGVAAWDVTATYVGQAQATYGGYLYTAQWWTLGDVPDGDTGVWVKGAAC